MCINRIILCYYTLCFSTLCLLLFYLTIYVIANFYLDFWVVLRYVKYMKMFSIAGNIKGTNLAPLYIFLSKTIDALNWSSPSSISFQNKLNTLKYVSENGYLSKMLLNIGYYEFGKSSIICIRISKSYCSIIVRICRRR